MARSVSYAQWSLEPYCIGMKLRALRTSKRLTLSRLSTETGLSTALLSKLETDRMIPTLPTLATICRVYGVGLSHFFCEPDRHHLSITRRAHLEGSSRGGNPNTLVPLNLPARDTGLCAQMIEIAPGSPFALDGHGGNTTAVVYVLEGRLQLSGGAMTELLDTGDCACIDSSMAFSWSAAGKHRCRILAVTTTPAIA
jgi:transcriptional regulator with XRE-family HTH domain